MTNMAGNSALVSLGLSALWLVYFYGANVGGPWFGPFSFDSSELPIITLYGMYVPMFIQFMRKSTDLNPFRRFVMPALALCACAFMGVCRLCRVWSDRAVLSGGVRRGPWASAGCLTGVKK